MKILITGAQGQLGKELTRHANEQGYAVTAACHNELDITKITHVENYIQTKLPHIVINAAAYTAVDKAEQEQDNAFAINRDGTENLAKVCAQQNIPLLHISTDYVFDGSNPGPYKEENTISPLGVYGESKWQGEEAIRKNNHCHIILRVAWVFGSHGNNFVKTMLRLGKEKDELNIVADQTGGPSPAKDIAKTLITLVTIYQQNKQLQWGTYHYCGNPKTTWYAFAQEIFRQAKETGLITKKIQLNPVTTADYPTAAKRPKNSMLDCTKLKNNFGIEVPDWRESLSQVLKELSGH